MAAGTSAPDFKLRSAHDTFLSLGDFRGRALILAFYPADWSAVRGNQMALYNEIPPESTDHFLATSVDGVWRHAALPRLAPRINEGCVELEKAVLLKNKLIGADAHELLPRWVA